MNCLVCFLLILCIISEELPRFWQKVLEPSDPSIDALFDRLLVGFLMLFHEEPVEDLEVVTSFKDERGNLKVELVLPFLAFHDILSTLEKQLTLHISGRDDHSSFLDGSEHASNGLLKVCHPVPPVQKNHKIKFFQKSEVILHICYFEKNLFRSIPLVGQVD